MKSAFSFFAFASLTAALCSAQVVKNRYVVELSGDSAVTSMVKKGAIRAAADPEFKARRAQVRASQNAARTAVTAIGGQVLGSMDTVKNALIVSIPDAQASKLSQIPGAIKVYQVHKRKALLDHALPLSQIPAAWNLLPGGAGSAGAGIKIAITDTGIDNTNPALQDSSLTPPAGFPIVDIAADQVFVNTKVIVARNYGALNGDPQYPPDPTVEDHDGHGTGVATAAAGASTPYSVVNLTGQLNTAGFGFSGATSYGGTLSGAAPKAFLGNYKIVDSSGGSTDVAIAKAIDDAVADGMDVINTSFGGSVDSLGDDIGVDAVEQAVAAGVICVIATSDSGPDPNTVSSPAIAPDAISVGASGTDRVADPMLFLSSGYQAWSGIYITDAPDPGQAVSGPLTDISVSLDSTALACNPLPANSLTGQIAFIQRGTCTFGTKINNAAAAGAIGVLIYDTPDNYLDFSGATGYTVGGATLPTMFIEYYDSYNISYEMAYNPNMQASLVFPSAAPFTIPSNRVADFSGRGPNPDLSIKPDVLAVGEFAVNAVETTDPNGELVDPTGLGLPFADLWSIGTPGGTSFATPIVAGAAAVLKGARPGLTAQQYRSLLINSASPIVQADGTTAGVQKAGAGRLNLVSALQNNVAASPTSLSFGGGMGTVSGSLSLSLTNVGSAADTFAIAVVPIDQSGVMPTVSPSSLQLGPGASGTITVQLNGSALAPGEYQGYIQVTGGTTTVLTDVPYWFGSQGAAANYISLLYVDNTGEPPRFNDAQAFEFQLSDAAGVPINDPNVQVTVVGASGARVLSVYPASALSGECSPCVPGAYFADINTGLGAADAAFQIKSGNASRVVVVPVE